MLNKCAKCGIMNMCSTHAAHPVPDERKVIIVATKIRRLETYEEMLLRLAGTALKRGIRIFAYPPSGDYFATSRSRPLTLHRVTPSSVPAAHPQATGVPA